MWLGRLDTVGGCVTETRIGVIGTANTHAFQYVGLLNGWRDDVPFPDRLPDGRSTGLMHKAFGTHLREAGRLFPESLDFSGARVTRLWSEGVGEADLLARACDVEAVDEPADAVLDVDAVMVLTEDPDLHLPHGSLSLDAGVPTFIDKPLAGDEEQARSIAQRSEVTGTPWFSCSVIRFDPVLEALCRSIEADYGGVQSVYVQVPLRAKLYASHAVEAMAMMMRSLDATKVSALETASKDIAVVDLADGRSATLENNGSVERISYTAILQSRLREHVWVGEDFGLMNVRFLRAFLEFARTGTPPVSPQECLDSFLLTSRIHRELARGR